ncbi:MAG: hypothetical protein KAX23_04915 [Dehalococcoidia bacterium]|jgi:hypothetical protein|nr:hypothetical protein [Dehalococcoidia bacterium]
MTLYRLNSRRYNPTWRRYCCCLEIRTVPEYLEQIPACGYDVVGYFTLPEDAWWIEYYGSLENRIKELHLKYISDSKALEVLNKGQQEIDLSRKYHQWYGSAFFVMQKR